jgi:malonyl-CoA/methylmalonyl-CoA synthetase
LFFQDHLLHVLPLHHTHGIVNCLLCPLAVGATVTMMENFDSRLAWNVLTSTEKDSVNVFMAVTTVYAKLVESFGDVFVGEDEKARVKKLLRKKIRLMVSGSAALPEVCLNRVLDP